MPWTISAVCVVVTALFASQQAFAGLTADKEKSSSIESVETPNVDDVPDFMKGPNADWTVPIHEQLENAMSRAKRSYNYPGDDIIININEINATAPGDDVRYLVGNILRSFNDKQCPDPKWPGQCPYDSCYKYTQKRISLYKYQVRCLSDYCECDEYSRCVCGG